MVTALPSRPKSRRPAARSATAQPRVPAQEQSTPTLDETLLAEVHRRGAKWLGAAGLCDETPSGSRRGVLALAADTFAGAALEHAWLRDDAQNVFERIALLTGTSPERVRDGIFSRAARDPRLLTLSPDQAIKAELGLLFAVAPVSHLSLWTARTGRPLQRLSFCGSDEPSRYLRQRVRDVLRGPSQHTGRPRSIHILPVSRTTNEGSVLAIRAEPGRSSRALELAAEAVPALSWILEREPTLASYEAAAQALAESLAREARIACDLHDGSLQDIAALASDLHHFRKQLEQTLISVNGDRRILGRVDDIESRIRHIDAGLRIMARDGGLQASTTDSFSEELQEIVEEFRAVSGIDVDLEFDSTAELPAEPERIVAVRVVQEALRNVARHSGADKAWVLVSAPGRTLRVEVSDNGRGFDVEKVRRRAIRAGRLGLRSMEQRASLLGGTLELFSGGPGATKVVLTLGARQQHASRDDVAQD